MAERTGRVGEGCASKTRQDEDADFDPRGDRRRGRGLAILLLAIGGLLVYLVWLMMWYRSHPASSAALNVRKGDAAARLKAIRALERLGPEDPEIALPALVAGLSDPEPANRTAAIDGLLAVIQYIGPNGSAPEGVRTAVAALLGRLEDPQPMIQAHATWALSIVVVTWRGTPRALELDRMVVAMDRMAHDPDPRIRAEALRGLGPVGGKISDDPPRRLIAALDDESEAIRNAAAQGIATYRRGLARLLPTLAKAIETTRPECRPAYLGLIREIRPKLPDGPPPGELIPALASALGSRDPEVRSQVAWTLGEFQDEAREAIPAVVAVLSERDEAGAPGHSANPGPTGSDAESPRGYLLPDPLVTAIGALRQVAGKARKYDNDGAVTIVPPVQEVVAALRPLLGSPNPHRRAAAIHALGSFSPDATLVPTLSEAAADRDISVRAAALRMLGDYAQDLDFPPPKALTQSLEDDAWNVRMAAANALASLRSGVEPMVPALIRHARQDPFQQVRRSCESTLSGLRPPRITAAVIPRYIEVIDSPESPDSLRRSLIEGLRRFGPAARAAVPALIRVLRLTAGNGEGSDPVSRDLLRGSAARALGDLAPGGDSAPDAIAALARDLETEPGISTALALGRLGPAAKVAAPALLRELERARDRKWATAAATFADALKRVAAGTPEEEKALAILMDYLDLEDKNSPSTYEVIAVVGRFGPRAAAALPRLRELMESAAPQVQEAARKAVAAIESAAR